MSEPTAATEREKDREVYAKILRSWSAVLKAMKLYTAQHPSCKEACQKFISLLTIVHQAKMQFLIHQSEGLFYVDDLFFIEESLSLYDLLRLLEQQGMSAVMFLPGVTEDELMQFCGILLTKPEADGKAAAGTKHINIPVERQSGIAEIRNPARAAFDRVESLVSEWTEHADRVFSKLIDDQTIAIADIAIALDRMIDGISQNPSAFSLVLSRPNRGATLHVDHAVRSMFFSVFIGQQTGYDLTSLKLLALSALLHDVGRLLLPSDFTTDYRLSPGDVDFIQLHARDGATFLAGVGGLPMSVIRATLEHHIGYDGQGYPELPDGHRPHAFSQIIAVADFVSWGTVSENHYHKPAPLHRVLRSLLRRAGTQFNPLLVKLFMPLFGFYPPGLSVELTTHERAIVVEANARNVVRPALVSAAGERSAHRSITVVAGDGPEAFERSISRTLRAGHDVDAFVDLLPDPGTVL